MMIYQSKQLLIDKCHYYYDDLQVEKHIQESDVILIVVTRDYLSSANCRRELVESVRSKRRIVLLLETDEQHGANTVQQLRAEVEAACNGV